MNWEELVFDPFYKTRDLVEYTWLVHMGATALSDRIDRSNAILVLVCCS